MIRRGIVHGVLEDTVGKLKRKEAQTTAEQSRAAPGLVYAAHCGVVFLSLLRQVQRPTPFVTNLRSLTGQPTGSAL
jgi:hypothetical protein